MHPQLNELTEAIARFLNDEEMFLEAHCPKHELSVRFRHEDVLARPKRSLGETTRSVPTLVAPAPKEEKLLERAERMGFTKSTRYTRNPFTGDKVEVPQITATFLDGEAGADWCLAAFQDIRGIGDAWLWITDLPYEDWLDPLPMPDLWPPSG